MKLLIEVLKAPWPRGARVGDVIELETIPAWAAGKCRLVPDEVEATISLDSAEAKAVLSGAPVAAPVRRGPGRPPKAKPVAEAHAQAPAEDSDPAASQEPAAGEVVGDEAATAEGEAA